LMFSSLLGSTFHSQTVSSLDYQSDMTTFRSDTVAPSLSVMF
jgi:hypothetical protein